MGNGMVWIGIVFGCLAGLLLAGWFSRGHHPPLETFFLRLLRWENRSMRTDTRIMLHELHRKVEDLSAKIQRMDGELQDLLAAAEGKTAVSGKNFLVGPEEEEGFHAPVRSAEVSNLIKEGFSPEEIAQRLNVGRGEVELILALGKKPFWVVENK